MRGTWFNCAKVEAMPMVMRTKAAAEGYDISDPLHRNYAVVVVGCRDNSGRKYDLVAVPQARFSLNLKQDNYFMYNKDISVVLTDSKGQSEEYPVPLNKALDTTGATGTDVCSMYLAAQNNSYDGVAVAQIYCGNLRESLPSDAQYGYLLDLHDVKKGVMPVFTCMLRDNYDPSWKENILLNVWPLKTQTCQSVNANYKLKKY